MLKNRIARWLVVIPVLAGCGSTAYHAPAHVTHVHVTHVHAVTHKHVTVHKITTSRKHR